MANLLLDKMHAKHRKNRKFMPSMRQHSDYQYGAHQHHQWPTLAALQPVRERAAPAASKLQQLQPDPCS